MQTNSHGIPLISVDLAFTDEATAQLYSNDHAPATELSCGTDLRACIESAEVTVAPGGRVPVRTGVRIQPQQPGWAGFVYSRSGLGARDGLTVAQGVGVIDPDYTGEITVFLLNTSGTPRRIKRGERIAQLIFLPFAQPLFTRVADLSSTQRGAGGFGHTGR